MGTEGGPTTTDNRTPWQPSTGLESLYAKLTATGEIVLDEAESNQLRVAFQDMLLRVAQLEATDRVNIALAEALQKQGFHMVREQNPDGTVGWNLQNKPQPTPDAPMTVN